MLPGLRQAAPPHERRHQVAAAQIKALALGLEAVRQKRRVLFTRAADLVRQLLEARDARDLGRLQRRLLGVEVLIVDLWQVDELGFVSFDRAGGGLLLNLLADRYKRRSTVVMTGPLPNGSPSLGVTRSSRRRSSAAWRITRP